MPKCLDKVIALFLQGPFSFEGCCSAKIPKGVLYYAHLSSKCVGFC